MDNVKKNWIVIPASLAFLGLAYKVFEQSVLEHHFIIPSTQWLPPALIAGNLVYYALKGQKWAIIVNFWICFVFEFMGFLSLFYSPTLAKTYFGPIWAGIIVALLVALFGYLLYSYQKQHELFKH
jgi:hypothetical protein